MAQHPVLVPVPVLVLVLVAGPMAQRRRRGRRRRAAAVVVAAAAPRNRRWTAARRRCRPRPRTGAAAPSPLLAPRAVAPRRLEVNHAPPARPRRRTAASRACCSRPRRGRPGRAPASVVIYLSKPRGDSGWPRPRRSPRRRGHISDRRRGRGPAAAACAPPRRRGAASRAVLPRRARHVIVGARARASPEFLFLLPPRRDPDRVLCNAASTFLECSLAYSPLSSRRPLFACYAPSRRSSRRRGAARRCRGPELLVSRRSPSP